MMVTDSESKTEGAELSSQNEFYFSCHADLPCFTQCCRDVNIYLTPYDVLRMRRTLNMGSAEFLNKYTRRFLAKVTHVPVVQLVMDPETLYCQFVGDEGCRIYDDRPWACRMYPLDPVASYSGVYRKLVGNERCLGLRESQRWTVGEWLRSQEVESYEQLEREYQGVMPKGFKGGQKLDPGIGKILFLAYDLDRFMEMLTDKKFGQLYGVDEETVAEVKENDVALLRLAYRYIRTQLEELIEMF